MSDCTELLLQKLRMPSWNSANASPVSFVDNPSVKLTTHSKYYRVVPSNRRGLNTTLTLGGTCPFLSKYCRLSGVNELRSVINRNTANAMRNLRLRLLCSALCIFFHVRASGSIANVPKYNVNCETKLYNTCIITKLSTKAIEVILHNYRLLYIIARLLALTTVYRNYSMHCWRKKL